VRIYLTLVYKMNIVNLLKNSKGSALLVSMLVMGVLISISLALSGLVFRELRITRDLTDSGKAYYAAESGVEVGLYGINKNLPGWEPTANVGDYQALKVDEDFDTVAEFNVNNRCSAYPCFDDDFERESIGGDLRVYYDYLELNESLNIPLFVVNESGLEVPVGGFSVQFFTTFGPEDLKIRGVEGWDVLRWKIYGLRRDNKRSESIGDFSPVSSLIKSDSNEVLNSNAENPSWFGSKVCTDVNSDYRYTDDIVCRPYGVAQIEEVSTVETEGQIAPNFKGVCFGTEASEYYDYAEDGKISRADIKPCYGIENFLNEHEFNYLTLTNMMNPAVFSDIALGNVDQLSRLYYRVELYPREDGTAGNQTVRNVADISANGYSGRAKQSIRVQLNRGSFLPVFNFSLYSTYKGEE